MVTSWLLEYRDSLILLARVLLMALFLMSGWHKLTNFSATVSYMSFVGAPVPRISARVAVVMEFFVAILLIVGVFVRPLALMYFMFTLATALIGHHYWTLDRPEREANKINFYKNLSIMAGVLLLAVSGPGRYAVWP